MPKGGFGNLIALPLQRVSAEKGNSVFVNEAFEPYPDQWIFLSAIERIQLEKVENIVQEASRNGTILGVRISLADDGIVEDPGGDSNNPLFAFLPLDRNLIPMVVPENFTKPNLETSAGPPEPVRRYSLPFREKGS